LDPDVLRQRLPLLGIECEADGSQLKLEVPHNRPDLLSVEGIARALKGFLGIETGLPRYRMRKPKVSVRVDRSTKKVRPYIACGVVRNVQMSDEAVASLMQIQEKLHIIYCRKRRKASIGVYDLDRLRPPIQYTTVHPEQIRFVPLEFSEMMTPAEILKRHPKGLEYAHLLSGVPRYPLLLDSNGVVLSLPPIVNSEDTKVTPATKNLFVDVTGTDRRVVESALSILMTSLAERGFVLEGVWMQSGDKRWITPQLAPTKKILRVDEVNRTIGLGLNARQVAKLAKKMRHGVARITAKSVELLVPVYRVDILHEIDLIEDIAIAYGYDRLEPTVPPVSTIGRMADIEKVSAKIRVIMVGLGFTEVMTYSLINRQRAELFGGDLVELANPISEEYAVVRNSLIPSLLEAVFKNQHHPTPQRFFEVGDVAVVDEEYETRARTVRRVAGAIVGKGSTFTNVRSVAEAVIRELGIEHETRPLEERAFIPGRAVLFMHKDKTIGKAGEIHPEVLEFFRIENPVAVFELDLGTI
jgi:phenylalanyl-tRNA synthetase beta chain